MWRIYFVSFFRHLLISELSYWKRKCLPEEDLVSNNYQKCKVHRHNEVDLCFRYGFAFVQFSHVSRLILSAIFQVFSLLLSQWELHSKNLTAFRLHSRFPRTSQSTITITTRTATSIISAPSTAWCWKNVPRTCISIVIYTFAVIQKT